MSDDHTCPNESRLVRVEEQLVHAVETRDERDQRFESGLKRLVAAVEKNHELQQQSDVKAAEHFGKLEAILAEQGKRAEEAKKTQDEIKTGLDKLGAKVTDIEHRVNQNTADIQSNKETNIQINERLTKVEKWMIYVIAGVTVISMVVQFISSFDSIKYKLFPELNNIIVEQKAGANK